MPSQTPRAKPAAGSGSDTERLRMLADIAAAAPRLPVPNAAGTQGRVAVRREFTGTVESLDILAQVAVDRLRQERAQETAEARKLRLQDDIEDSDLEDEFTAKDGLEEDVEWDPKASVSLICFFPCLP